MEAAEATFAFDGEGGVSDAWLESEPHAHMLVEELMILANEAVAELLGGRRREALYRVHDPPEPQSIARLLAVLADLGVPTPAAPDPDHLTPARRREARCRDLGAGDGLRAPIRPRRRRLPAARSPVAEAGSLRPRESRPLRPREPGVLPLHVTDSALSRSRLPSRAAAGAGVSDEPMADDLRELAEHASAREREATNVEYAADAICLAWLLERRLFERGWEHAFEGEITGAIPSGIFVRFDEVFEGYVPRTLAGR